MDEQQDKKETKQEKKRKDGEDRSWLREPLLIAVILVVNLALVWRFASVPFTFVFSAPVIPDMARFLGLFGVEFDWAVRWLLLAFFILGPVSLYFLVREITGRRMSAMVAAILYSLPVFASRFEAIVVLGDGAHIAALTLVPLAAYWLLRFLKRGSFHYAIGSSLSVLLVALTSPFGLFVLIGVLTVVTFSEMLLGSGRLKFMRLVLVLVFSGGLSAFWYNPEFVRLSLTSASGRAVMAALKNLIPLSFFIFPVLGTFGFLIFDKRAHLQPLFVALGLTVVFGLISFAGGLAKFAVSSQSRYLPEVSMSLAVLWGVVGAFVYDMIRVLPQTRWFPVPLARRDTLQRGLFVGFIVIVLLLTVFFPYRGVEGRGRGSFVAGVTSSVAIDIGEIRELTGGIDRAIGYVITLLTMGVMGGMFWWMRREELGSRNHES